MSARDVVVVCCTLLKQHGKCMFQGVPLVVTERSWEFREEDIHEEQHPAEQVRSYQGAVSDA
ncbi:hypothetical protein DPMN_065549 [Dreissena polymorpha]|uniref:Uncharacterized protein n=1 Tax=Dreissena polymorpha TaxID=45954 RepID=A0A9D3YSD9_DREPO|nr:hypothetical protein DPMN_065549 [Dreissena polymorpha]